MNKLVRMCKEAVVAALKPVSQNLAGTSNGNNLELVEQVEVRSRNFHNAKQEC